MSTRKKKYLLIAVFVILFFLLVFYAALTLIKGEAYQRSLALVEKDQRVIDLLGAPIHPSYLATGEMNINSDSKQTSVIYTISGPKADAKVTVNALHRDNEWILQEVIVDADGKKIKVVDQK